MQQHARFVTGRAHQTTEALIHFLKTWDAINQVEGLLARLRGTLQFSQPSPLASIHLGQCWSDYHRVRYSTAK